LLTSIVSREVFESLVCNRCGRCCEGFTLCDASPLDLIKTIGLYPHSVGWMDYDVWIGQLIPLGSRDGGKWHWYRCPLMVRGGDVGTCTVHDHRPGVCYHFPYGRSSPYEGCPWHVEILEEHLPWMPERFIT